MPVKAPLTTFCLHFMHFQSKPGDGFFGGGRGVPLGTRAQQSLFTTIRTELI